MKFNSILLTLVFCLLATAIFSQNKYTISGYIRDIESGEDLLEANVYIKENPTQGTNSNIYGFYSLTMESGEYTLVFSYLGYTDKEMKITLNEDTRINVDMGVGVEIEAVVVYADAPDQNEQSTRMGTVELDIEQIKKLPTLLGEVDIFKAIQLLPGVQSAGEGNSGFYVRGGGPDQNLVLLDEAVVYNTGHLLGFFSVFNPDVVKNTTLIKGSMPANYGGRLSSVVDVQMKDGNNKGYQIEGGLGLIASRLSVQGPIVKDKSSFMLSGRRTYAFDLAQPLINTTDAAGTNYYFYDVNGKFNYKFSDKDRIFVSTYWGDDVLNFKTAARDFNLNIPYGNLTTTVRWNHLFSDKLFMNVSAIYNKYDFEIKFSQDQFAAKVVSGIRDWNGKVDFDYYPHPKHEMKFGVNYTHHKLTPQNLTASSGDTEFELAFDPKLAHELGIYVLDDWKVTDDLTINIGFRLSSFTQIGPYTSKIDGDQFGRGEAVKTYVGPEPRISAKYSFKDNSSIKAGVAQTNQYLHLVSSSTSTLPSDIWVPSSELIKPQRAQQYALGYFKNFKDNMFETSVELYYKNLQNQIDFQESYVNQPSEDVEDNFVFGEGSSYGVEFFINKKKGNLTGWIGYTLSKTQRRFDDINNGNPYPAIYDRRHDLSVVANYELNDKWNFGAVFVYGTGNAFTRVKSFYFIEGNFVPEYGVRNQGRIDAYHRLDLSATLTPKPNKPNKKIDQSWTFSVYNAYNRRNVYFIYYVPETNVATGEAQISAFKVSLFPVIPSVSWNFKWKQKKKK
ncbi:MAG: hypothetical protein ACI94Y_001768 [Maribacter sp.]|jgi:hypothetical protein